MKKTKTSDLEAVLADIQAQLAALTARLDKVEGAAPAAPAPAAAPVSAAVPEAPKAAAAPPPPPVEEISEQEVLAISAALAAYFGVRVKIRQIRLLSSTAWAQQGRVSIQASHRLAY